jgi:hypothetical protein
MSEQVSLRFVVSAEALKLAADTIGMSLALLPRIENPSLSASPNCIEFGAFARPRGWSSGGHYKGGSIGGHYTGRSVELLSVRELPSFQGLLAGEPLSEQFRDPVSCASPLLLAAESSGFSQ